MEFIKIHLKCINYLIGEILVTELAKSFLVVPPLPNSDRQHHEGRIQGRRRRRRERGKEKGKEKEKEEEDRARTSTRVLPEPPGAAQTGAVYPSSRSGAVTAFLFPLSSEVPPSPRVPSPATPDHPIYPSHLCRALHLQSSP